MKRWRLVSILGLAIIIGGFYSWLGFREADKQSVPAGWLNIRPPHEVSALALRGDAIWAGGKDGVYEIDQKTGAVRGKLAVEGGLSYVKAMVVDRNNVLWIGYEEGLIRYDGLGLTRYTVQEGLPDDRVNALALDLQGDLWVGTWGGAAKISPQGWQKLTVQDGLLANMVNAILCDSHGGLWFGSYVAPKGGLSYFRDGRWSYFSTENGLPHNNVNDLLEDSDRNIWVGTGFSDRGGACQLAHGAEGPRIQLEWHKADGLAGEKVRSLFQDRAGMIWLGSEYDGIARWDGGAFRILTTKDGLTDNEVKCMLQDGDGNLWLGTRDGVTLIRPEGLSDGRGDENGK